MKDNSYKKEPYSAFQIHQDNPPHKSQAQKVITFFRLKDIKNYPSIIKKNQFDFSVQDLSHYRNLDLEQLRLQMQLNAQYF